jgi:hypothetical protein
MVPVVDPATLSTHPKFDALYRDICNNKLNVDGSTAVDEKAKKERAAFAQVQRAQVPMDNRCRYQYETDIKIL